MNTPIGPIKTNLTAVLVDAIHSFENEYLPVNKESIRIYMSQWINKAIFSELEELMGPNASRATEFMGYTILPDYHHRITIVDIEDQSFKKIKQFYVNLIP